MDAHTLNAWTRFALQKGGIGTCTALIDNPATEPEDLMFMSGETIIVLRRLDEDGIDATGRATSSTSKPKTDSVSDADAWFLGYCEGVVGRFKGAHVQIHGRLKKPVLMRRSAAGSIRDSSMRPMSKSEAAKMHMSQVPAGIPVTAVNSDGEEDSSASADTRPPPLPPFHQQASGQMKFITERASSRPLHSVQAAGLTTPPLSDEGHLRKQSSTLRPRADDEDSDDSSSLLPWARQHSRESSAASRSNSAQSLQSQSQSHSQRGLQDHYISGPSTSSSRVYPQHAPGDAHLPPSPISSGESPITRETSGSLSTPTETRSGHSQTDTSVADITTRTSFGSSSYTTSTNEDSDDEQAVNARRDYTFSIYDVYGRDSVAFPNFDFREHGSKSSNLSKLGGSRSNDSLNSTGAKTSSERNSHSSQRQQLHPSQIPHQYQPQQAHLREQNLSAQRSDQLTVPQSGASSIPVTLRSPSGRRPSAAPDPRMHAPSPGPGVGRGNASNMASSLRRQVEASSPVTPTSSAPPHSPISPAGSEHSSSSAQRPMVGPGYFDPRRRPSQTSLMARGITHPGSASTPGSSFSGSSPSPLEVPSNDSSFARRPGFAEAREKRRSTSVGNIQLDQLNMQDPSHQQLDLQRQQMSPNFVMGRPSFRSSAGSTRSRHGPPSSAAAALAPASATSPGLGPVRASSDRLSERERVNSGHGSGLLRKNPSNPTPGLHGGSGLHGLSPMARSTSPMSQLSAPSPTPGMSRPVSGAGSAHSGVRSPLRSPLAGSVSGSSSTPGTPLVSNIPGAPVNFDAMGFVVERGVPPSMPQIEDLELKEKWQALLNEDDVASAKKSRKVKKLVRAGVPASIRGQVWLFLANASVRRRPGLFEKLCKTSQGTKGKKGKEEAYETIEKDLHRTMPDHKLFMGENATGKADLEGILKSYVHFNPIIGYTQGMGLLAGFSMLHMPAEDAFWLLCAVLRDPQMEGLYTSGMKQLHVDSVVFGNLLQSMDAELHARFEEVGLLPIMFTPNWFLPLFTRVLPWTTLARVWDVFFFEGPTWILRVALAIVRIMRDQLMNRQTCPTSGEMLQLLLHPPHHNLTPDNVLTCAFSVKLKDGEMRKLSRTASKLVREQNFLNKPADARGRSASRGAAAAAAAGSLGRSTSAPARRG